MHTHTHTHTQTIMMYTKTNKNKQIKNKKIKKKLWDLYKNTDPFVTGVIICFLIGVLCFIHSSITGVMSQIDKLWPFSVLIYMLHFSLKGIIYLHTACM